MNAGAPDDAGRDFAEAEELCEAGHYEAALTLLDALDTAYPQARNIMYLRALCLARSGQPKPAKALGRQLLREFNDLRAIDLLREISRDAR